MPDRPPSVRGDTVPAMTDPPARVTRPGLAERLQEPCCEHPRQWPHHAEGIGCLHEECPCRLRLGPRLPEPWPPGVETQRPRSEYL